MSTMTGDLRRAMQEFVGASEALRAATRAEMQANIEKPIQKGAAIRRLIGQPDESSPGKIHSASSAEKVVESEPRYYAHLQHATDCVVARLEAECNLQVAKWNVTLAIAEQHRMSEPVGALA